MGLGVTLGAGSQVDGGAHCWGLQVKASPSESKRPLRWLCRLTAVIISSRVSHWLPLGHPAFILRLRTKALGCSDQGRLRRGTPCLVVSLPEACLGFSPSHQLAGGRESQEQRGRSCCLAGVQGEGRNALPDRLSPESPARVSSQWLSSGSQASLSHALSCEQSPLGTCGQLSLSSELWARDAGCVGNVGTGGGVEYVLDSAQAHTSNTARGQRRARRERKREKDKAEASSQRAAVTIAVSIVAAHTS